MFNVRAIKVTLAVLIIGLLTPVSVSNADANGYLSDPNFVALSSAITYSEHAGSNGIDLSERVDRTYPASLTKSMNILNPRYYLDLRAQINTVRGESLLSIVRGRTTSSGAVADYATLSGYLNKLYFTSLVAPDLGVGVTQGQVAKALSKLGKSGTKYITSSSAPVKGIFTIYKPSTLVASYSSLESTLLKQLLDKIRSGAVINPVTVVDNEINKSKTYTISATHIADQPNNSDANKIVYTVGVGGVISKLFTYTTNTDSNGNPISYDIMSITYRVIGGTTKVTLGKDFISQGGVDRGLLLNTIDKITQEDYAIQMLGLLVNLTEKEIKDLAPNGSKNTPLLLQGATRQIIPVISLSKGVRITLVNTRDGVRVTVISSKTNVTRFIRFSTSGGLSLSIK